MSTGRILLVVGLGTALSLIGDSSLYTVLPTHLAEAGIVLSSVGIMLSANRWVRLVANSAVGWVSDRWPRRRIFVPALFLGAFSTGIYGLVPGFWPLLIGRLLWGIAWAGIWVAGNAIVLDIARDSNRGRLVGLYNAAFFTGTGLGSFIGGTLTDWLGYHAAFQIAAGLALAGALAVALWLPETVHYRQRVHVLTEFVPVPNESRIDQPEILAIMGLIGVNRIVMAGFLFPTFGLFLLTKIGEFILVNGRQIGITTLTGIGLSAATFIGLAFGPLIGGLSDKWGHRWRTTALGLLPGIAGFSLLSLASPWTIVLGLPLVSATSGSNQGMATTLLGDVAGTAQSGRWLGLLFTVGDLASAIGPLLAFWAIRFVDLVIVYLAAGLILGVMFMITVWMSWRRRLQEVI